MQSEAFFYNAIALVLGGNRIRIGTLFMRHRSWEKAWKRDMFRSRVDPRREWTSMEQSGVRLLMREDSSFPELLREIPDPPFGIYIKGRIPDKDLPVIAVVGTRNPTPAGKRTAFVFSETFSRAGFAVASGLALGIDASAHLGSLAGGAPGYATLAGGLDHIYPGQNRDIADQIIEAGGTIISEYPIGSKALPYRFIERNRVISGLSRAVLVVEAPAVSGALSTASHAARQNRDVYVVPGPVHEPRYAGSHALIRDGAMLVTEPCHILQEYDIWPELDKHIPDNIS